MNKQKGVVSMVVMVAMLVMAIALPVTTKLVQQNQENRSKATSNVSYSGTCRTGCINNACKGSALQLGGNYSSTTEADCLCGASNCSKYYVNRSGAPVGCEETTSNHVSLSACTGVAGTTCYPSYSACKAATSTPTVTINRDYYSLLMDGGCSEKVYDYKNCKNFGGKYDCYSSVDSCWVAWRDCSITPCSKTAPGTTCQRRDGGWSCVAGTPTVKPTVKPTATLTPTTYNCSAKACSANYGCMRNGDYKSSTADCKNPIGAVSRTYDAACPKISDDVLATLGDSGNNDKCQTTSSTFWYYSIIDSKCKETGKKYTNSSDCQSSFLASTKGKTTGQYCYSNESDCQTNYKNDSTVPSTTTYNCSAKACSANYGCMRNGDYKSSTADCKNPIGAVSRTYDAACPKISDDVLATLGDSGNNDKCQTITSCTSGDKQCSGNILQKCNSDGSGWETDTDCEELSCDATTKTCKVVSSTCGDIPTTCKDKDFTAYKAQGDFNCSGAVDINDFNLWKGWFNADKEQCGAIADFTIWKDAFNKSN